MVYHYGYHQMNYAVHYVQAQSKLLACIQLYKYHLSSLKYEHKRRLREILLGKKGDVVIFMKKRRCYD